MSSMYLFLASCVWSVVALVLGLRFIGRRNDKYGLDLLEAALRKQAAELQSLYGAHASLELANKNLAHTVEPLVNRLAKLEAPVNRKQVVF